MAAIFRLSATLLILSSGCLSAATGVHAQSATRFHGASIEEGQKRFGLGSPQPNLGNLGYVLADGILFLPTANFEAGFNSNPDKLFTDARSSAYGSTNLNSVLGFVNSSGATTIAARGTLLQYDEDIANSSRWDAGLAVDNAYAISPGTVATFGGYYLRDEINLVPSDNAGGYGQLTHKDSDIESFARVKVDQIAYRNGVPNAASIPPALLPFIQNEQFNVARVEGVAGFIFGPSQPIGVYGELGGANLDYFSQNEENLLDRDAMEFWVTAGLRFRLDKTLIVDTGWRFNQRDFEDHAIHEHDSNFFDGRVTFTPADNLRFVAEIDRIIVEPVTALALAGERTRYAVSASYKPSPLWEIAPNIRYELLREIGDVQRYEEIAGGLSVAYQFNERTALYGLIDYEAVEETTSGDTYDKLQIGAGTRVKF
jgi:hypothetical protein